MAEEKKFSVRQIADNIGKAAAAASDHVSKGAVAIADKTKEAVSKSQEAILNAVDQNGNGEIDIEDVIVMGLKVPGIRIDRTDFLQAELQSKFPQEVIEDAIAYNPLHAGISRKVIDKIADAVILNAVDQNGNGEIDIEDVIVMGLKVPGIRIDRTDFLQAELQSKFPQEVIEDAIAYNPLHAGISRKVIDKIADAVIQHERICVSGISAALGTPGGIAMAATIPADIAQYYGYMLRATQKLMYLYGFPAIDMEEKGHAFDSETMNILIICMGVMYGAAGANNALKAVAKALASGVEKQLLRMALTKGTIYPIVKSVAKWFSVNMTKQLFAGFFKKAIPVVGGVIGGGVTYLSFKPCCDKLKASLQNTMLSNPDYYPEDDEGDILIVETEEAQTAEVNG